jgi:hypothetical protein
MFFWDGKIFPSGSRDHDLEWMHENENALSHGAKGKHSHDSQGVPNLWSKIWGNKLSSKFNLYKSLERLWKVDN